MGSRRRDTAAARRFFEKAIAQNGVPQTVTVDKSGANLAALQAINAERETTIKIWQNLFDLWWAWTCSQSPGSTSKVDPARVGAAFRFYMSQEGSTFSPEDVRAKLARRMPGTSGASLAKPVRGLPSQSTRR